MWIGAVSRLLLFLIVLVGLAHNPFPLAMAADHVDLSEQFVADLVGGAFEKLSSDLPEAEKRAVIRATLRDALAVESIARFSLGPHWPRVSVEKRQEYLRLFEDFLLRGSVDRMMRYSGQRLEIQESVAGPDRRSGEQLAMVRSQFYDPDPIRIVWVVASQRGTFKIVDVVIEGFSLTQTYRDDFTSVVRRQGIGVLLGKLRDSQDVLAGSLLGN